MDLLERYLNAVATQLPKEAREDIIAELRDMLLSRFEDREATLGRALTDDEREAILREMGHPLVVAGRYRKGPQSLIGPELFPWWMFAVKAGVMVMAAVQIVVLLIQVVSGSGDLGREIGHAFNGFFEGVLFIIGVATVTGAVFEHQGYRPGFMSQWRVKDLPVFNLSDPDAWGAAMQSKTGGVGFAGAWNKGVGSKRWPGGEAMFSVVAGLLFVAWWTGLWPVPGLMNVGIVGGEARLSGAPIWTTMYAPILLLAIGQILIDFRKVVRPHQVRTVAAFQAVSSLAALTIVWIIFNAGHWFTLSEGASSVRIAGDWIQLDFDRLRALDEGARDLIGVGSTFSLILSWVMAGIMMSLAVSVVVNLWRLMRGRG